MSLGYMDAMKVGDKYRIAMMTDEELVELYLTGRDEHSFEAIFNRYSERIYATAYRITHDHHDAEEILQEVFLTLTKKMDTFRADAKFSSWLYRIAVNASYERLRAERKHGNDISLENYAPYDNHGTLCGKVKSKEWSNNPYLIFYKKETMDIIEKAIDELPEKYRIVFHLSDIEQLTHEEISDILGITVSASKSRLHRARLFVRDKISDYFHEWRKK